MKERDVTSMRGIDGERDGPADDSWGDVRDGNAAGAVRFH
jgi:hypothetical protein